MFKKNKPFMTKQDLSVKPRELPILQEKKKKIVHLCPYNTDTVCEDCYGDSRSSTELSPKLAGTAKTRNDIIPSLPGELAKA